MTLFLEPEALADLQNRLVGNRLTPQAQFRLAVSDKQPLLCTKPGELYPVPYRKWGVFRILDSMDVLGAG